jgi:predicted Zn finger-like uncharacterized protein
MSIVLSCPNCATRYRAESTAIGAQGRRVRCTGCGHVWTAQGEEPEELELGQDDVDSLFDDMAGPAAEPEPAPEPEPEIDKQPVQAIRARAEKRRRAASMAAVGGAWGGLAFMCASLLIAASIFRVDIVTMWPRAASAYAAVGMDVNPYGFEIDPITISRETEAGTPVLVIEGAVRNVTGRSRATPELVGVLFDESGALLMEWPLREDAVEVEGGESHAFRTVLADPPPEAREAEIRLAGFGHAGEAPCHGEDHAPDHAENAADEPQTAEAHH